MAEDTAPGPVGKAVGFARRARQTPNVVDEVAGEVAEARATLEEIRRTLDRLGELTHRVHDDGRAGVTAIGTELEHKRHHFEAILARLDGTLVAHAAALHRAVAAPGRAAAADALRRSLGPPPPLRRGLSVFTLCWEHGELLATSVASALAVLDLLPAEEQGQVMILDDASTDSTPRVAAALAAGDPRVRVIRSEANLGLALARTTLLHAAETSHAFQLDADNTAIAPGVVDLYRVATSTGAAVTYGNVVQLGVDDVVWGPMSNEPPTPALFRSNYVDTMALSDVAAYRALGGWPTDPLLEHIDDWAAIHHVIESGLLVAFVPTLVGRYRQLSTGFHHTVPDERIGSGRVARVYDPTGRRRGDDPMAGIAAVAVHPDLGPLWATPAALALDPDLAPPPPEPVEPPAPHLRVLVVGSGGVSNLGDDALTVRGVERAVAAFGADAAVDLITDGQAPCGDLGPATWLGPLHLALRGLRPVELGPLHGPLADAAGRAGVGTGHWRPFDPAAYDVAVILGSGLTSLWSDKTIEPRALLVAALTEAGVPYACSGHGLGPFEPGPDTDLVAGVLAGAVAVSTRDHASARAAVALPGVEAERVTVTGDDALGLAPAAPPWFGGEDAPVLAVTVRNATYVGDAEGDAGLEVVRRWARAVDAVAVERGWSVRAIALNTLPPEPEVATLAALRATTDLRARWQVVDCGHDPRHLVHLVADAAAMAAQSYHAALFALAAGVPAVLGAATPYYVGKARGLAGLAGLPEELAVADPAHLARSLDAVAAALPDAGSPLDGASAAAEAWWEALPGRFAAHRRAPGASG